MQTLATIIFGEIAVSPEHDSIHDSRFRYKARGETSMRVLPSTLCDHFLRHEKWESMKILGKNMEDVSITYNIFNDKNKIAPCSTIVESPTRRTKA